MATRRRLKLTGFARFFIVMLFLVPVAYLAAAYYNGQDGIQNIKHFLGIDQNRPQTEQVETPRPQTQEIPSSPTFTDERPSNATGSLDSRRLDQLEKRMNEVERENARLREQLRRQQERLEILER